ncbi:MAG: lysophospholipid acyltransferase family protein [Desulfonauticus sp.]|nr:lysophospholipid acyltransferase family protein [Desulfonauticus sp.]
MYINLNYVATLLTVLLKLWSGTLKYTQINYNTYLSLKRQGQYVLFGIWHGELFPLCYIHRSQDIRALVSPSQDGEIIAQILKKLGYDLARGSSHRTGVRALVSMIKSFRSNPKDMVITLDGPTGPRHKIKDGILYLAYKLNLPILPARVRMDKRFVFKKSWDKFELPYPFSTCRICYGDPVWVKDLDKLDNYKNVLYEQMESIYGR